MQSNNDSLQFSNRQFSTPDLVDEIRRILDETGVDPSCIRILLREGAIMQDSERMASLLSSIKELGVGLYVADFGVGNSSLASLQCLPVSALKVGRGFVRTVATEAGSALVHTIIALAHNLGLKAIADGVETEDQLCRLVSFGCDYAQGFLFSKPVGAQEAAALLARSVDQLDVLA